MESSILEEVALDTSCIPDSGFLQYLEISLKVDFGTAFKESRYFIFLNYETQGDQNVFHIGLVYFVVYSHLFEMVLQHLNLLLVVVHHVFLSSSQHPVPLVRFGLVYQSIWLDRNLGLRRAQRTFSILRRHRSRLRWLSIFSVRVLAGIGLLLLLPVLSDLLDI